MRDLAIAYGNSRQAKKWVNKTIRFDDLKERLKATIKVAQNYKSYSGLTDQMDGEVKFIYKTEEINNDK